MCRLFFINTFEKEEKLFIISKNSFPSDNFMRRNLICHTGKKLSFYNNSFKNIYFHNALNKNISQAMFSQNDYLNPIINHMMKSSSSV